jgi:nucleotide-binding universal stress UspA family protein
MTLQAEAETTSHADPARPGFAALLATDGSEQALKAAHLLARFLPEGSKVELLTVLSMELDPWTYLGELSDAEARRARIEEQTDRAVGEARRILEAAGHATSVRRRFGNPSDEVLAEAEETAPDLVVVGRRGLGRAASLMMGSVSTSLLRHCRAPLLIVP